MRVIADLHGGDPEDLAAKTEFREIKERVIAEVLFFSGLVRTVSHTEFPQRESGEARTYTAMWRRYKRRILLAMSSQAFAQLVCNFFQILHVQYPLMSGVHRTGSTVGSDPVEKCLQLTRVAVISYYARKCHFLEPLTLIHHLVHL